MSKEELDQALNFIERSKESEIVGPQDETFIRRSEELLGVVFPPTYRLFLARLGCAAIGPDEFYGIDQQDFDLESIPNAIWLTLSERELRGLPASHVVVGVTGDGGDYVIDTSQRNSDGECPVLEWWFPEPEGSVVVAKDFGEFLWNSIRPDQRL